LAFVRGYGDFPRGVLLDANFGHGPRAVKLVHDAGIFALSIPSAGGRITLKPQLGVLSLKTASRTLRSRLASDRLWRDSATSFFTHAVLALIQAEEKFGVKVPWLGGAIGSRQHFRENALRGGGKKKPGQAGGGGVDVLCFVPCMQECEDGAEVWEVWVHAECLIKCAIKCGKLFGRIFPD
jgi:hypothetical protein